MVGFYWYNTMFAYMEREGKEEKGKERRVTFSIVWIRMYEGEGNGGDFFHLLLRIKSLKKGRFGKNMRFSNSVM